jgi:GAF domain-containing protein
VVIDSFAERIAAAAREMEGRTDPSSTMEQALLLVRELVPNAQQAGFTMLDRAGTVETAAATSDEVARIDELQYEHREGPCLDAIWDSEIVRSADVSSDDRWPDWGPRVAHETGLRSMLCFRLFTDGDRLGALNLHSRQSDAFDDADVEHGLAMATHSAIAVSAALQVEHLKAGMDTRTVIGQAQGILMERFALDADRAFAVLARLSSHSNRKLREVAADIAETRRLPGG